MAEPIQVRLDDVKEQEPVEPKYVVSLSGFVFALDKEAARRLFDDLDTWLCDL